MSFKDQSFSDRFADMGDQAEGHFELYATDVLRLGFVRYGLNRPPIQMHTLPKRIAYTPDYLMSNKLVEVQGLGRDQTFKLKFDKWNSLRWWNDFQRDTFSGVFMYVWDSHKKRECMFHLNMLDDLMGKGLGTIDKFAEGKPYIAFYADMIFEGAS